MTELEELRSKLARIETEIREQIETFADERTRPYSPYDKGQLDILTWVWTDLLGHDE